MNKDNIYNLIKEKGIWHEIEEHEAVFNMKDLAAIKVKYPEYDAKNLFVRDDKKKEYYLITVKGDKRVDLNKFKEEHKTRRLSFASPNDLESIMNLIPGAVSPLGLLNDNELKVKFYIDNAFLKNKKIIGIHPNDNTATLWLKTEDLIEIIKEHGNEIHIIKI